jgi:hypothetical protein
MNKVKLGICIMVIGILGLIATAVMQNNLSTYIMDSTHQALKHFNPHVGETASENKKNAEVRTITNNRQQLLDIMLVVWGICAFSGLVYGSVEYLKKQSKQRV